MDMLKQVNYTPAKVTGGYTDRILRIDVKKMDITVEELPPDFKKKYVGGRGYALKLIWDGTSKDTRYDSPENILVMASGPLGNEPGFPGTSKFIVGTISPLTDTFMDSNVGGHFGPLLKLAGFDALAVSGIAEEDVAIVIDGDEGSISIVKAPSYGSEIDNGSLSYGDNLLKDIGGGEYTDTLGAVTTGEGALKTRFGIVNSIFYDNRRKRLRAKQAGRGGTGTVMRVKKLRGVVVRSGLSKADGNKSVEKQKVRQAGSQLRDVITEVDHTQLNLAAWGTTILAEYMNRYHLLPVRNYRFGQDDEAPKIFAGIFLEKYLTKGIPDGCYYGCNLACAKSAENIELTWGPYAGRTVNVDGPEYETIGAVTSMGIFDPLFVLQYNWYCDEYGMDTISTGVTISFFMECFEKGYITAEDTGCDLSFGNVETVGKLMDDIANARGFGKTIGQGVARGKQWVAEKYSAKSSMSKEAVLAELKKFAMELKGLEFSLYVTKESLAQQGGYGFALKGPQHDEAWLIFIDQVNKELPTFEDKADALKWFPLIRSWFNATGLCKLPWIDVRNPLAADTAEPSKNIPTLDYYVDYFNGTTGSSHTLEDILTDSERLYLLQKMINLRQGKGTRESDRIPLRAMGPVYIDEYESRAEHYEELLKEQLGEDNVPATVEERHKLIVEKRIEDYEKLCDIVYEKKGFTNDGIPKRETVSRLSLMDEQASKLLDEYNL
ncbi:aldehyde ferredoxin oxidoreductase family protein [Chloroflexota bacterium]